MANHKQRGESASWQHLYKRSRWLKMRERHLMQSPLCVYCLKAGDVEPATICDHRTPHKGKEDLFWDKAREVEPEQVESVYKKRGIRMAG